MVAASTLALLVVASFAGLFTAWTIGAGSFVAAFVLSYGAYWAITGLI